MALVRSRARSAVVGVSTVNAHLTQLFWYCFINGRLCFVQRKLTIYRARSFYAGMMHLRRSVNRCCVIQYYFPRIKKVRI